MMIDKNSLTFNSPFEAGVRAVALLGSAYPEGYDIQRLVAFDYLLVRTSILDGPTDLHPPAPIQPPATEVRRKIVQDALHLMMTRDLVQRDITEEGFTYRAGETAAMFLEALSTPYISALKERAQWLTAQFSEWDEVTFDQFMRELLDKWIVEFQDEELDDERFRR
ncbi:ABC-three component system middle component 2 [Pseudovibrio denitrificans]|uniref:ABC-three component system middle component 2 n=1 Tax=Pseudovibrio denitrificans TaxID=258256 RepID=UPI0039BEF30D